MSLRKSILLVIFYVLFYAPSPIAESDTSGYEIASTRAYFIKDYQYFKPMIANLRTSQNHLRTYWAKGVGFSNSTKEGKHWFLDPAFGGYFPFLGYNFAEIEDSTIPMQLPGFAVFVDGSTHLLLDMHTKSSDVINTDYRLGIGIALRAPTVTFIALRYRYFHESTHIGDEYTLYASKKPDFRRYNVSYEAHEIFLSFDHNMSKYDKYSGELFNNSLFSYMRFYAGLRHLNKDSYEGFTGLFEPSEPIILSRKDDYQLGGEIYFRASDPPEKRADASWYSRLFSPQNIVFAVDFSRDDLFNTVRSEKIWSTNIVVGFLYGDYLGVQKGHTVRWQLSLYNGVNPHGQFRAETTSYFAIDYVIDF